MTYPEYEAKVNEMVANPDKIAAVAVDLLQELKKDTDALTGANDTITKHESRIRELQETNYQLFLRATGDPSAAKAKASEERPDMDELTAHLTERFGGEENGG